MEPRVSCCNPRKTSHSSVLALRIPATGEPGGLPSMGSHSGHGTTDWFQIGKGVCQGCILSPCLFNFYAEYIMRNTGLEETQAGIKIARRNINNLRYADDTILMPSASSPLPSACGLRSRVSCLGFSRQEHRSGLPFPSPMHTPCSIGADGGGD